jgi:hypothetical protein
MPGAERGVKPFMTIYDTNKDGEITIVFDTRWQFPETFGYKPEDREYKLLRGLWEEATDRNCTEEDESGEPKRKKREGK